MKKGINIWAFPGDIALKDCIQKTKIAGFSGIELALSEKGELSLESSEKEILTLKRMAEDEGIEIPSLASNMAWEVYYASADRVVREKAVFITKRQIETAAILGTDTVMVLAGPVGSDSRPGYEVIDYEDAYKRTLDAMQDLKQVAELYHVHMSIENVRNKFLLSPLEVRDLIDKINSCYVSFYLDVGNIIPMGYPEQWVRILNHRINKFHIKDYSCSLRKAVPLLEGDVDFSAVMKQIRIIGYNDYLTVENTRNKQEPLDIFLRRISSNLDRIIEMK